MKKFRNILLLLCIGLIGVLFINAVNNDYEKEIGGKHQIKDYKILSNNDKEAKLEIPIAKASKDKVNPSFKILAHDDPIYKGEDKVIDPSLGKYRVELQFTDVRLQKKLSQELKLNKQIIGKQGQDLLESIKMAYPPDDSLMVMYLGCSVEPQIEISETEDKIIINLKK